MLPIWRKFHANHVQLACIIAISMSMMAAKSRKIIKSNADDWRERCRQIVSGQYLEQFDAKMQAEDAVKMLEQHKKVVAAALKVTMADYQKMDDELRNADFDKTKASALQNLRMKMKYEESLLADKEQAQEAAKADAEKARISLERFTTLTAPVFRIDRAPPAEADPGYGVRLEFKSECPRHRNVCPLPAAEAKALGEIAIQIEKADDCVKYSTVQR